MAAQRAHALAACSEFHEMLPGYRPTPLRKCPALANALNVANVLVKDESDRFSLPAFKILGVSWAVSQVYLDILGRDRPWRSLDEMRQQVAHLSGRTLLTATAGNHGRALARMARWIGVPSLVLVPSNASQEMVHKIEMEGAQVRRAQGEYDDAVLQANELAQRDERYLIIQDTARPGYEKIPGWIVEGYDTLFREIDEQLLQHGISELDLLAVPVGVGSLMAAAIGHAEAREGGRPRVVSVETDAAPCVLTSLKAGRSEIVATRPTLVEALNAGTVSSAAWPIIRDGVDAAVAVSDAEALAGQSALMEHGVRAGICGGATLAGVRTLLDRGSTRGGGAELRISADATIVLICTDGA